MSLLDLVLILAAIGICLYAFNRWVPCDPTVKQIVKWVVVIVCVLIVLNAFGVIDKIRGVRVPRF